MRAAIPLALFLVASLAPKLNGLTPDIAKAKPKAPSATVLAKIEERRDELKVKAEEIAVVASEKTGHPAKLEGLYFPGEVTPDADLAIMLLRLTENDKNEVVTAAIFTYGDGHWTCLPFEFYPYGYTGK